MKIIVNYNEIIVISMLLRERKVYLVAKFTHGIGKILFWLFGRDL